jgi:hypothetical protein
MNLRNHPLNRCQCFISLHIWIILKKMLLHSSYGQPHLSSGCHVILVLGYNKTWGAKPCLRLLRNFERTVQSADQPTINFEQPKWT